MKQIFYSICCITALAFSYCIQLSGETTEVVLSNAMKCTKEELMRSFPEQLVFSILDNAKITKEQATEIAKELSKKDKELARLIEEKTEKLGANKIQNLSQRDQAIRIYRETLYEVFAKVLKAHGITDDDQIQNLLEELGEARSKLFIECIRKQPVRTSDPAD